MVQEKKDNIIPPAVNPALRRAIIPTDINKSAPAMHADMPNDIPSQFNNSVTTTKSDLSFEIKGEASQFIELKLRPGQSITGEVTALMYYENGINMKMRMSSSLESGNGGFLSKLLGIGKAAVKGQKLFMMSFSNTSQKELKIAFSMPYSGSVVPIDLSSIGSELFCQNDSFLCATSDLKISSVTPRDLGANFLNAVSSIQKIQGNGTLFLFCGGALTEKKLLPGEALSVTAGTALAMQPSIIFKNKTIRNVGIAGQGHLLTEISGSGRVWLQSLPYSRKNDHIINSVGNFFGIKPKKKNPVIGGWQK